MVTCPRLDGEPKAKRSLYLYLHPVPHDAQRILNSISEYSSASGFSQSRVGHEEIIKPRRSRVACRCFTSSLKKGMLRQSDTALPWRSHTRGSQSKATRSKELSDRVLYLTDTHTTPRN